MRLQWRVGHAFKAIESGYVVAGSNTVGLGTVYPDTQGQLRILNPMLDGTRTIEQIVSEFCDQGGVSQSYAMAVLNRLIKDGHLENAAESTSLLPEELSRYSRSIYYLSWLGGDGSLSPFSPQEVLLTKKVLILGVGGIGGAVALQLLMSGVKQLTLVDSDFVEESNLNRQVLYSENDVDKLKVEAARDRLLSIDSSARIEAINLKVSSPDEVRHLIEGGYDLIFRCADTPFEMPVWVSNAAIESDTPWIDASYAGPMVVVGLFYPGVTGCYRCLREDQEQKMQKAGALDLFETESLDVNPGFGPVVSIVGGWAAYEGLRFLITGKSQLAGRILHQNLVDYTHQYYIEVPADCAHRELNGEVT